jgi:hypothetical protein
VAQGVDGNLMLEVAKGLFLFGYNKFLLRQVALVVLLTINIMFVFVIIT